METKWYEGKEYEILKNSKVMSDTQLSKFYNVKIHSIEHFLYNKNNINSVNRIESLTEDEVFQIYNYVLIGERSSFPKGFGENKFDLQCILKYLLINILEWDATKALDNFQLTIFEKYKLKGLRTYYRIGNVVDMINNIFKTNYKIWEFKKLKVPNGYWETIDKYIILNWLKDKLFSDQKISNIYEAYKHGLINLIKKHNLVGFSNSVYGNNVIRMFEEMYDTKFDINIYVDNSYNFNLSEMLKVRKFENSIYKIHYNLYGNLDEIGKTLLNEIVRFCEIERRYPNNNDLLKKNGYISYAYYKKYFKAFSDVFKYIEPLDTKPEKVKCRDCNTEFYFTEEYFVVSTQERFGLLYQCKKCNSEYVMRKTYKKYGINLKKNVFEISPEKWWEMLNDGTIPKLPDFCHEMENKLKILRHVFINICGAKTKEDICNKLDYYNMIYKYRLSGVIFNLPHKIDLLNMIYPEFHITEDDLYKYNDFNSSKIIEQWLKDIKLSVCEILNNTKETNLSRDIFNLLCTRFESYNEMMLWYFNFNNIKHPAKKMPITIYDFKKKSRNFLTSKENRIGLIKHYCENVCNPSITEVINNTEKLKLWTKEHFTQSAIWSYTHISPSKFNFYKLLTEAYPIILENKILFEWEWHQVQPNYYTREKLKSVIAELVTYRMNNVIIDTSRDIPRFLNHTYMSIVCPKLNSHIYKHFNNYYRLALDVFPAYKDIWTPSNFGDTYAYDGVECSSIEERLVYEYIKRDLGIEYIKSLGTRRSGKYVFELDEDYEYGKFCPDFVVEYIKKDNKKIKLNKPIILEYYGMFVENHSDPIFVKYKEKVEAKNKYYNSKEDICFIPIYPNDIKNNFKNLVEKLSSFYLQNFNYKI